MKPLPWGFAPQPHLGSPYLTSPCRRTLASHPACSFDLIKTRLKASRHRLSAPGMSNDTTAVFVLRFFFQTVGRLSNDATYSSGRNNGGTLFCCRDERCLSHCRKGGHKQCDVNASRFFFSLLPHVEPITVPPHERDMNRSSVAARMERHVMCVDTSTFERAVDSRCITIYGIYSKRKNPWKNLLHNLKVYVYAYNRVYSLKYQYVHATTDIK